jgi:hypothetical protein
MADPLVVQLSPEVEECRIAVAKCKRLRVLSAGPLAERWSLLKTHAVVNQVGIAATPRARRFAVEPAGPRRA